MSVDFITAQLKQFKKNSIDAKKEVDEFCHESPFLRTKREVQQELARAEKYRASILRTVTTFAGLSAEALITAAQSMEEVHYIKGDDIIEQDDIGDSFFVLEEGQVVVTRKANMRDYNEKPKELARLSNNAHFGEIALLTAEPRSATVTVISDTAKCLCMTKAKFDELLATTNKLQSENRRLIGRDVLETVPLFRSLTAVNKKKLLDAMIPMTYLPSSYICRQATTGNSFFILTEGHCRVTINCEDKTEKEVGKLRAGDFFGEIALMEVNNRRTANVISVDTVSCLTLARTDFNRLLASLKVKLMEASARGANNNAGMKTNSDLLQTSSLANKRRISTFNTHGHRDENRVSNLFKRFAKFTTEALWMSLYSRMYREMVLDPSKQIDYGVVAETVMRENDQRFGAVQALAAQAQRILEMDPPRRSLADHSFIMGLLRQRNDLREKLCKAWPSHQFGVLCKRIKIQKFMPHKKIFEIDSTGTAAYLILRGAVRMYSKASSGGNDVQGAKAFFEQDLGPGEVFGEAALGGLHARMHLAQAITHVEVVVIDDSDFMAAQDKDSAHMGTEERQRFLAAVPMFKNWDAYKLLRLAHALIQEEVNKGVVLTHHGKPSKDLYFVVNGMLNIVSSLDKRYVITPLHKHDYIGESCIINRFIKASASKLHEEFYCIAVTKVEVLILPDSAFTLFDLHSVDLIRSTFLAKMEWRRQRVRAMKYERAKMRKHLHFMGKECEALHRLPVDTEYLSEEQVKMIEETHARSLLAATAGHSSRPSSPGPNSRPGSPTRDGLPDIGQGRPSSPVQSSLFGNTAGSANRPKSAAPTASTTAHGHSAAAGDAPVQEKLDDIEDIPTIFIKDMDRFMVAITCKTERERAKFANTVSNALRPKSARAREFAAKTRCENSMMAKRADVLAVLADKDATRSKLIIKNRRNSAAVTAHAVMHPSHHVRPRTAGELQGRNPIERDHDTGEEVGFASRSFDSGDSNLRKDAHVSTSAILNASRQIAMASGGVDYSATPAGSPSRELPGITPGKAAPEVATRKPFMHGTEPPIGIVSALPHLRVTNPDTLTNTGTSSAKYTDELDPEHDHDGDAFDPNKLTTSVRVEGESHTPFGDAVTPSSSKRRESTSSGSERLPRGSRRGSMGLRGSLIIPSSQSYADTISRSDMTPKSAMAIKLEATIAKYIHNKR